MHKNTFFLDKVFWGTNASLGADIRRERIREMVQMGFSQKNSESSEMQRTAKNLFVLFVGQIHLRSTENQRLM